MTFQIDQLLTSPEGKTLEFKRDLSSPGPMLKTLIAFANTAGGRLIVGIDEMTGGSLVWSIPWMRKSGYAA